MVDLKNSVSMSEVHSFFNGGTSRRYLYENLFSGLFVCI